MDQPKIERMFRMGGGKYTHIKWQMTVMAKNLLLEEFPLAEKELKRKGNFWTARSLRHM